MKVIFAMVVAAGLTTSVTGYAGTYLCSLTAPRPGEPQYLIFAQGGVPGVKTQGAVWTAPY